MWICIRDDDNNDKRCVWEFETKSHHEKFFRPIKAMRRALNDQNARNRNKSSQNKKNHFNSYKQHHFGFYSVLKGIRKDSYSNYLNCIALYLRLRIQSLNMNMLLLRIINKNWHNQNISFPKTKTIKKNITFSNPKRFH